jgi:hypothetical protein
MQLLSRVLLATLLIVGLSGCGLLSRLVPDQDVDNVFGIDGATVVLSPADLEAGAAAGLDPSSSHDTYVGAFGAQVTLQGADVPYPVAPRRIVETIGIQGTVVAGGTSTVLGSQLNVVGARLAIEIRRGDEIVLAAAFAGDEQSIFVRSSCGASSCIYVTGDAIVPLLQAELGPGDSQALFDLIRSGGTVTVSGSLELDVVPMRATALHVTIATSGGRVSF